MSPLSLDYRPQTFDEVVGNKATIDSLKSIMSRKDRPKAYLLQGPSGCGKTTIGRIIARELGCDDMEFHEMNAANTRGIDAIREVIQKGFYAPIAGRIKVFLWDEAHQLLRASEEALLKFIEEPPIHVYNILCTTNPEKIIKTIKTRCSVYTVSTLISIEMRKLLKWVIDSEKIELHGDVINALISASEGCPRKLLVMLDQIVDIEGSENQLEAIINTSSESVEINTICQTILGKGKPDTKWPVLAEMLKSFDQDPEQTRRGILGYFSKVLLGCKGEEGKRIAQIMELFSAPYYDTGKSGLVESTYMACLV